MHVRVANSGTPASWYKWKPNKHLECICNVHAPRGGLLADELLDDGQRARAIRAEDCRPSPVRRRQNASGKDVLEVKRRVLGLFRYPSSCRSQRIIRESDTTTLFLSLILRCFLRSLGCLSFVRSDTVYIACTRCTFPGVSLVANAQLISL